MISIVTGTLDRLEFLSDLIKNTVHKNDKLELVIVDGGSTDGTINFIKNLNNPNIKLVEVGQRSSYPHFMNLGIQNSKYEWICQWNDDVLLCNDWGDVINEIEDGYDFYIFNWKYGDKNQVNDTEWLKGEDHTEGWCILDESESGNEIVMNYGIYNKKIFREIGLYNPSYVYYFADSDMSHRTHFFGYKHKSLKNIKVCSLITEKKAFHVVTDENLYSEMIDKYKNKQLPNNLEFLK
jgi:glycosyltransferase involved in cell wall biosynthesis